MSVMVRSVSSNTPKPLVLTSSVAYPPTVSPWYLAWRRLRRNQLALLGVLIVLMYGGMALGADALAPYGYRDFDFQTVEGDPSYAHFMGTDFVGRDVFTLLMYGARVSFSVAAVVPVLIILIGVPLGLMAGFFGGSVDNLIMRLTDIMFAFPAFLFMVLIVTTFGRSLGMILLALGVSSWPLMTRLVRSQVMQVKQADYVLAARAIGTRRFVILVRHVLPNLAGTITAAAVLSIPSAIMAEAFLTYLGIGVEPTIPSWGMLINNAQQSIFWHPMLILIPSLAISSLTLGFSFLGDGIRDALDPRMDR